MGTEMNGAALDRSLENQLAKFSWIRLMENIKSKRFAIKWKNSLIFKFVAAGNSFLHKNEFSGSDKVPNQPKETPRTPLTWLVKEKNRELVQKNSNVQPVDVLWKVICIAPDLVGCLSLSKTFPFYLIKITTVRFIPSAAHVMSNLVESHTKIPGIQMIGVHVTNMLPTQVNKQVYK
uniref:Uncharacterized protein n=1 Tax=Tetranychus urticae TaxID=32264 RepID=T1KE28_TETUR